MQGKGRQENHCGTALSWKAVKCVSPFKSLYIRRTVNHYPGFGHVGNEPKTAKSRRKIVLAQFVIDALKRHQVRQDELRLKAGASWHNYDLVFCNTLGDFQETQRLGLLFRSLLEKAGLPQIRFHDLRHSAATIMLSM